MKRALVLAAAVQALAASAQAQQYNPNPKPGEEGSRNIKVVGHMPPHNATHAYSVTELDLEQELSRPYAYIVRRGVPTGFEIITIKDPAKPKVLYSWRIENAELHRGSGSMGPSYVKTRGRYYYFNSFQFQQGGPDVDLGAIVWDVTGLPDTSTIKEVARLRVPEFPGGFHESFAYKHSNGQALVVAPTTGPAAYIYDMDRVVAKDPNPVIGKALIPDAEPNASWHDFFVGFDPVTRQDKLYAGGRGGGFVFDITNPTQPRLIASVTGSAGQTGQHTFVPTPDHRYVITQSLPTYQYSPARVFDLKPALDGTVKTVSRPIGAWMPSWNGAIHNLEVRWPYVFVSGQSDGFHVFNMMDPTNPYSVGFYVTRPGPFLHGEAIAGYEVTYAGGRGNSMYEGASGVDVRNADGLIVISDWDSGFWAFKMEGFEGWNGHQWGVPNVSSVQDWDNGPDGAPKPQRVSVR